MWIKAIGSSPKSSQIGNFLLDFKMGTSYNKACTVLPFIFCKRIHMVLIGHPLLDAFTKKHIDSRVWIDNRISDTLGAKWKGPQDIKKRYASASFLQDNIIIFNVKGNSYRLETQVAYQTGIVSVKWVGTHAEYTRKYK